MNLREEFEKAFKDNHKTDLPPDLEIIAKGWMLIGTKWALNFAANHESCHFRLEDDIRRTITDDSLRHIANEIEK